MIQAILLHVKCIIERFKRAYAPVADLRITVVLILLGTIAILGLDPGRDVVRDLVDEENSVFQYQPPENTISTIVHWLFYWFACIWTGLNAWYWANLLYKSRSDVEQPKSFRVFRRVLGIWPLATAIAAMRGASTGGLGAIWIPESIFLVTIFGLLFFFIWRTTPPRRASAPLSANAGQAALVKPLSVRLWDDFADEQSSNWLTSLYQQFRPETHLRMARGDARFVAASLVIAFAMVLLLIIPGVRTDVAWAIGPAALAFGAIGCIIPITSIAIWLTRDFKVPIINFGLVGFLLFSLWNDNHALRTIPSSDLKRPSLEEALNVWEAQHPDDNDPLILIATAGGASRAAYWTGTVLSSLDAATKNNFSKHVFAISSVSGGSLGAVGYAAWLGSGKKAINPEQNRIFSKKFFGADYLGPALAGLLFPDLIQRFWPFCFGKYICFPSRATSLEEAFEMGFVEAGGGGTTALDDDFLSFWQGRIGTKSALPWVPLVFSNGTHVETGKRLITAPVQFKRYLPDVLDIFDEIGSDHVRASTAILNSARFPIVSPPATLQVGPTTTNHLVDGGYFENGGIETMQDLLRAIQLLRPHTERNILLLEINNDDGQTPFDLTRCGQDQLAFYDPGIQCDLAASYLATDSFPPPKQGGLKPIAVELTAIISGLYDSRSARGVLAGKRISQVQQLGSAHLTYYRFQLGALLAGEKTTMSWSLSKSSRNRLDAIFEKQAAIEECSQHDASQNDPSREALVKACEFTINQNRLSFCRIVKTLSEEQGPSFCGTSPLKQF